MNMKRLLALCREAESIVILGHIHPDGDCVGACLGLFRLLRERLPEKEIRVVLEPFSPGFGFLSGADQVCFDFEAGAVSDLCICLDASDPERLGGGIRFLRGAAHSVCIDHHITNTGFAEFNLVCPEASSASEMVASLLPAEEISREAAECLFLGIVHDTGVFKHSNTSEKTMCIAGALLSRGVSPAKIIDGTIYKKTFAQNRILGTALNGAELSPDGKVVSAVITRKDLEAAGAGLNDLEGIIDQLRVTDGVEMAVLLYETEPGEFKISLRSNETVDVSRIAREFGGGGHVRASGGHTSGDPRETILRLKELAAEQILAAEGQT